MAKLKIYTFPDNVLAEKAEPIERVEKPLHKTADDMLETMYEAPGIGLAANQVGILKRILVMDTEYEVENLEDEDGVMRAGAEVIPVIKNKKPKIIINPTIVHREGEILFKEGCLSCPEFTAEVPRAEKIKVEYLDIDGKLKTLLADGLQAVCIQHEIDHLDGKLFIERLSPVKRDLAKKKLIKVREETEEEE